MKFRMLSFFLIGLGLMTSAAWSAASEVSDVPPRLTAKGNTLVDPDGNTVVLRGLSLPYLSQPRSLTVEQRIDRVADAGANVIRLPLYAKHRAYDPMGADEKYLRSAVEHATARGLYVIVDFHAIDDLAKNVPQAFYFWHVIAPLYADQPNVIYELYNEDSYYPNKKGRSWSEFKSLIQPVVDIARERAPETLLLVSAPAWSHQLEGILDDPIDAQNIAYVSHLYPGHDRKYWQQAADVAAQYPVFVTEFGWQNAGKTTYTIRGTTSGWGQAFYNFLEENGMSWTAFTYDTEHQPIMVDEDWNLLGGEDYCGEKVFEWLKEHSASRP
jgi:endoglucanase